MELSVASVRHVNKLNVIRLNQDGRVRLELTQHCM